jgi:uncharacterized protein involved in exopolysaccharide biosynthesis
MGSIDSLTAAAGEPTMRDTVSSVSRRWIVPVIAGGTVFSLVAAWTFLATPRYQSRALLRIDSRAAASPMLDELKALPGIGLMGLGSDELETEIGVLKSQRMADAVLDSLALTVRVRQPAGSRAAILRARTMAPATAGAVVDGSDVDARLRFTRADDGQYRVEVTQQEGDLAVPTSWAPGDSAVVGRLQLQLLPALRTAGPATIELDLLPRYKAMELFEKRLDIRTQEGGSHLVSITFEDADREVAAAVVERLVAEYLAYTLQNERADDGVRTGELRREVAAFAKRLADAEERLRAFKEQRQLVIPDEQATAQLKRISLLRTQLDGLEVERTALARLLALVTTRSANDADPSAYRQLATFPSLIANRAIQDYLMSLVELENARSTLSLRRTSDNDEMQQLTGRIAELERQLQRVGAQYLESLEQQIAVATQAVKEQTTDLDLFPRQEMDYVRLLRERTILNEGYVLLQKQLKQAELQTAMRTEKVRVVDAPRVANVNDVAFPRVAVQLLLGLVLGVAVALVIAFGRDVLGAHDSQANASDHQNAGSANAP